MKQIDNAKIAEFKNLIVRAPVVALLGLPLAPFALHFYYYCDWSIHLWSSNEMLQYVAVALPAYATIALSYYTVLVNINLQEINEKLVQINEQSAMCEAREQMPLVDIVKNRDTQNLKAEFIYDTQYKMYRIKIWIAHSFDYAIKKVYIKDASLGIADNSFKTNTIEANEAMKFTYEEQSSYVKAKALLPSQETVFALYFEAPKDFDDKQKTIFCLSVEFENENNSGQRLHEELTISFWGKPGLDDAIYKLYSQEIHYEWC